jgi:PAS domain S-box-containing protein
MPVTVGASTTQIDGFAALFARHPFPAWVFDLATTTILAANDAARARYGFELDEFLGRAAHELHPDLERSQISVLCERLRGGVSTIPGPSSSITKSGKVLKGCSTWSAVPFGHRAAVLVVIDPADKGYASTKGCLPHADLLDLASDAIMVCDLEGTVTFWNQGATRLYGWQRDEAIGAPISHFVTQDVAVTTAIETNVREGGQWSGQMQQVAKDGRALVVNSRWTLVHDERGKASAILVINTDVTETKNLEAQFLRAQRLESIGTLASGIAHDLNNVLSPILMSAGLLRRSMQTPEEEKLLAMIESSAERGAGIVHQVLTFARGVDGERVLLQPKHILSEVSKILTQTFPKSIEIRIQLQPDLWTLLGDASQIQQVVLNLCNNSRDAMPNGGLLSVVAENFQVDHHFARTNPGAQRGDHVVIRVTDSGTGMSAEVFDKIFDPFFTTKDVGKGTGLGLPTVIGIVKSHSGFVTVQSEPNVGTSFHVFLPAARTEAKSGEPPREDSELLGRGELVLVVDDEAPIREALVQTLQDFGYRAYTAEDGSDALALYVQRKGEIDVVLTDLAMGLMDGVALTRSLRRFDPQARVIVSSGHCAPEQASVLKDLGVTAFLNKPYNANRLLKALRYTLDFQPTAAS